MGGVMDAGGPAQHAERRDAIVVLGAFLVGQRWAVIAVAGRARRLWPIGVLLLLSAGLAREYDGEYLVAEPWYLLVPLVVSTGMATLLWGGLRGISAARGAPRVPGWLPLVVCYWMSAPLAWLYAIPYERFLDEFGATRANLWTLALVAAWRAALMIRVVQVLCRWRWWLAAGPVMLFASVATMVATAVAPVPPVQVMGGIRTTAVERIVQGTTMRGFTYSCISLPLWVGLSVLTAIQRRQPQSESLGDLPPPVLRPGLTLFATGALSAVLLAALPWTQAEQARRYQVEQAVHREEFEVALRVLSAHQPSDFPPLWHPPPRAWQRNPDLFAMLRVLVECDAAPWVRAAYYDSLRLQYQSRFNFRIAGPQEMVLLAELLEKLPEIGPVRTEIANGLVESGILGKGESEECAEAFKRIWAYSTLQEEVKELADFHRKRAASATAPASAPATHPG